MKKLNICLPFERMMGLTLPNNGVMYVCDYDEVFKIELDQSIQITVIDENPRNFFNASSHYLGIEQHQLIHKKNGNSISYNFNPLFDFVQVNFNIKGKNGEIRFPTLSGDWFAASFSQCGKYLVLAEPYGFEVYQI